MPTWFYVVLALCVVALTVTLVVALVSLARTLRRTQAVLGAVERELDQDLSPLLKGLRELVDELRLLSRGATTELERIVQITARAQEVTENATRLLNALAGLTRAGQIVGLVAGIKAGVDVFVHRLRK
jgi:ABC-type siderophore export system fused ATPase/permease subunit